MNRTKKLLLVAAMVAGASWLPATAGEGYIGASYLNSTAEFFVGTTTDEDSSGGFKVFGGYNFIPYFGFEATYYDLGSWSGSSTLFTVDASADVWDISGRGILPIGKRFEAFARLGYSYVTFKKTETGILGGRTSVSASDWEFMWGVGIGFKIGKRFGIRAEYENWEVQNSLNAWSIGAYFRFGQ